MVYVVFRVCVVLNDGFFAEDRVILAVLVHSHILLDTDRIRFGASALVV